MNGFPRIALGAVAVFAIALGACSSDDYGQVGTSLPLDVSQDSVLVEAPALDFAQAQTVEGETTQPYVERTTMFLGVRDRGGFRASPVFRFDLDDELLRELLRARLLDPAEGLSSAYVDTYVTGVDFDAGFVLAADVEIELFVRDDDPRKALKAIQVYETPGEITEDDAGAVSIAPYLGTLVTTFDPGPPVFLNLNVELPVSNVVDLIARQDGTGLVLYDASSGDTEFDSPLESNFVAFAGNGFTQISSQLDPNLVGETVFPELRLTLDARGPGGEVLGDIIIGVPAGLAFTVIESELEGGSEPVLSSYEVRRVWWQLQSGIDDVVPPNATINRAFLTVFTDSTQTLVTRNRDTRAEANADTLFTEGAQDLSVFVVEAALDEADRVSPLSSISAGQPALTRVTSTGFSVLETDSLRVDITRYMQRVVNGVVDPQVTGLLFVLGSETFDFDFVNFHGPDSPIAAKRPRVQVFYTPPADSWE